MTGRRGNMNESDFVISEDETHEGLAEPTLKTGEDLRESTLKTHSEQSAIKTHEDLADSTLKKNEDVEELIAKIAEADEESTATGNDQQESTTILRDFEKKAVISERSVETKNFADYLIEDGENALKLGKFHKAVQLFGKGLRHRVSDKNGSHKESVEALFENADEFYFKDLEVCLEESTLKTDEDLQESTLKTHEDLGDSALKTDEDVREPIAKTATGDQESTAKENDLEESSAEESDQEEARDFEKEVVITERSVESKSIADHLIEEGENALKLGELRVAVQLFEKGLRHRVYDENRSLDESVEALFMNADELYLRGLEVCSKTPQYESFIYRWQNEIRRMTEVISSELYDAAPMEEKCQIHLLIDQHEALLFQQ